MCGALREKAASSRLYCPCLSIKPQKRSKLRSLRPLPRRPGRFCNKRGQALPRHTHSQSSLRQFFLQCAQVAVLLTQRCNIARPCKFAALLSTILYGEVPYQRCTERGREPVSLSHLTEGRPRQVTCLLAGRG